MHKQSSKTSVDALDRILIVEDDSFYQTILARVLAGAGYKTLVVDDGYDALSVVSEFQPVVVISDWMMPSMDGIELLRRIRTDFQESTPYLILLTAKDNTEDLVCALDAGADEYLVKPCDNAELLARVRSGIRLQRLSTQLRLSNQTLTQTLEQLEQRNQQITRDLEAAARIQRSLTPCRAPNSPGVRFAWQYHPCDHAAGDVFNVLRLDRSTLAFYILDVSGHGVPAAMLSVAANQALMPNAIASNPIVTLPDGQDDSVVVPPHEVLTSLNGMFSLESQGAYLTMCYATYNTHTRELQYCLAGHPPPLWLRQGKEIERLPYGDLPIGIEESPNYTTQTIQVAPGDRIILYTDGLTESSPAGGVMFGEDRLHDIIQETCDLSLEASLRTVVDRELEHRNHEPLRDDLTLFGLEVTE